VLLFFLVHSSANQRRRPAPKRRSVLRSAYSGWRAAWRWHPPRTGGCMRGLPAAKACLNWYYSMNISTAGSSSIAVI
jgi:hypothetical protein